MKVDIGPYPEDGGERDVKVELTSDDTYSLDNTLAYIIHDSLVAFKKDTNSTPPISKTDVPDYISDWDEYGYSEDAWLWILDEMIWAFWAVNHYEKDGLDITWLDKDEVDAKRFKAGLDFFSKYFTALWW